MPKRHSDNRYFCQQLVDYRIHLNTVGFRLVSEQDTMTQDFVRDLLDVFRRL